jgi:hypothetical protein
MTAWRGQTVLFAERGDLMAEPWRFWITGGLAAVLAAAAQDDARSSENARTRISRYGARETVQRIELVARDLGLPLFAKLAPRAANAGEWLIVLGSDTEHTLVLQSEPGAPLELPLTVRVATDGERGTEVRIAASGEWLAAQDGVPPEVAARLADLPKLVDAAIG